MAPFSRLCIIEFYRILTCLHITICVVSDTYPGFVQSITRITPILGWCLFAQGKFVFRILQISAMFVGSIWWSIWWSIWQRHYFSAGDPSVFRLPHLLSDTMVPIIVTKAWVFLDDEGLRVTCCWVARRYSRTYRTLKLRTSWCLETCHWDPLGIAMLMHCGTPLDGTTSSGIDALGLRLIVFRHL